MPMLSMFMKIDLIAISVKFGEHGTIEKNFTTFSLKPDTDRKNSMFHATTNQ